MRRCLLALVLSLFGLAIFAAPDGKQPAALPKPAALDSDISGYYIATGKMGNEGVAYELVVYVLRAKGPVYIIVYLDAHGVSSRGTGHLVDGSLVLGMIDHGQGAWTGRYKLDAAGTISGAWHLTAFDPANKSVQIIGGAETWKQVHKIKPAPEN